MGRADRRVYAAHGISVLTVREGQIEEIVAFLNPDLLEPFGLQARLPA